MSKYTKGPWVLTENGFTVSAKQRGGQGNRYYLHPVANCSFAGLKTGSPEGNAQLIAAAPEMYEALKAIKEASGLAGAYSNDEWAVKLRAAIATAEGQEETR